MRKPRNQFIQNPFTKREEGLNFSQTLHQVIENTVEAKPQPSKQVSSFELLKRLSANHYARQFAE